MTSSFDEIFSCFLLKVTDYKFINEPEDVTNAFMIGWLHSALSKPYIRRVFSNIEINDDTRTINFQIKNSVDAKTDIDYIQELVASAMVVEWMEPKVKSVLNMAQMYGGKEQKFFSQAAHLKENKAMLDDQKAEIRKMIRDHGYIYNSYIGERNDT